MQLQLSLAVADKLHEALLVQGEPIDALEAARALLASPTAPSGLCHEILGTLVAQDRRFCWATAAPSADDRTTRRVSLTRWEAPDPDLADIAFVALDLETTGARPGTSKITEVGAVRIEGFREVARFSTLVNPMRPIPPMITQITGITAEMVADAPRIEEVVPGLLEFLEGAIIVAHNAPFDVGFLNYELKRLRGKLLGEGAIDTLPLARALAPGLPNYKLGTVAEALGAPVAACHRALADAQAAGHVFVTLAGRLQEKGITRLEEARSYVSPASRSAIEKLHLTRDIPRAPGIYRFVDKDARILYVGKADRLRERVRSYFVANAEHARKVRQAVRLVERIEWDETATPLEAVVREQQQILEYRPPCNVYGGRPENYVYLKAGGSGLGLRLYASSRAPKWLTDRPLEEQSAPPGRAPFVLGPFRGRARLGTALDLLHRCYPVRRCPRRPDGRPCVRGHGGRCLAPCTGDPDVRARHDALVMEIIHWLMGEPRVDLPDPLERADEVMRDLSRQRRFEEAQRLREACDQLMSVRRSYRSLAEACGLRFAALWPSESNGSGPSVRMNLVWDGRLWKPTTLEPESIEHEIDAALACACQPRSPLSGSGATPLPVAVPQKELDSLLAVRRWFHDADGSTNVSLITSPVKDFDLESFRTRLVAEATRQISL